MKIKDINKVQEFIVSAGGINNVKVVVQIIDSYLIKRGA